MDIPHLLAHPDELNQETLYDLRRIVGVHPTYHAARILFLQNLFLLHDTTFDQELRRAALLVPDRRVLCNITQFGGLQPMLDRKQQTEAQRTEHQDAEAQRTEHQDAEAPTAPTSAPAAPTPALEERGQAEATKATVPEASASGSLPAASAPLPASPRRPRKKYVSEDTTLTLLNNFLGSTPAPLQRRRIKADPSTDYMAYLTQADEADTPPSSNIPSDGNTLRMDELIDSFITSYENGIQLSDNPSVPDDILIDPDEAPLTDHNEEPTAPAATPAPSPASAASVTIATVPGAPASAASVTIATVPGASAPGSSAPAAPAAPSVSPAATAPAAPSDAGLTETLAAIYIKQQKYDRALEIMTKMQTSAASSSNPYLADQVRFLHKLAINSRHKR